MASLRSRVLASVLLLSAIGLVVLAVVTYAEQRSFLQGRLDQEVRAAAPAMSRALDLAGFLPASAGGPAGFPGGDGGGRSGASPERAGAVPARTCRREPTASAETPRARC